MLITTRNSVYRLVQNGSQVVATKIGDLKEGTHPSINTGAVFTADSASPIVIGEPLYIGNLETSNVMEVDEEPGDEAICFKPINLLAEVNEERFNEALRVKLGDEYERALDLFVKCGKYISFDVTNVLLHAADQGKVGEVLSLIEKHHAEHLQYQHPNIRGRVSDWAGVNYTEVMFLRVYEEVLRLQRQPA